MRRTAAVVVVAGAVVAFGATQLLPDASPLSAPAADAAALVAYDGCVPLVAALRAELHRTATPYGWGSGGGFERFAASGAVAVPKPAEAGDVATDATAAVGSGATGTNVQEQGVDEPDIAKIAGGLVVTIAQGALQVVRPGARPALVGTLALPDTTGYGDNGAELLLDGGRALVISPGVDAPLPAEGDAAISMPANVADATVGDATVSRGFMRGPFGGQGRSRTVLRLADLSTPSAPRWLEEWSVDGGYVSARLVGGAVRLVTRSTPTPEPAGIAEPYGTAEEQAALLANQQAADALSIEALLPHAVHSVGGHVVSDGRALECRQVSAAPGATGASLLSVTTLRPAAGLAPVDAVAVRADGDLVYAAADRLFVATSRWGTVVPAGPGPAGEPTTQLHSFDTSADAVRYVGSGDVPGFVLGRWALSWYGGALRVATTEAGPATSTSTLTTLRESAGRLVTAGRLPGLGRGERIQAVRYFGDRATVVTFRQTDPLYVLDLSAAEQPRLLGELKVPGFSTYLHPVGGNRLLGLGMEADVATGRTTGLQSSLFDLADPTHPTQLSRLALGEGYSEALTESRAFSYDPAHRLAVLPIMNTYPADNSDGFAVGITVGTDGVLRTAGRLPIAVGAQLRRVLGDGDRLYAVTDQGVVAASPTGLAATGSVAFPPR